MGINYSLNKNARYPTMHNSKLTIVTQIKESTGLFDYDNQKICKQQVKINHTGVVVRNFENHNIKIIQFDQLKNEKNLELYIPMFQISYISQNYLIQGVEQEHLRIFGKQVPKKLIYLNINVNQPPNHKSEGLQPEHKGFEVKQNDSIKLGKLVLDVIDAKSQPDNKKDQQKEDQQEQQVQRRTGNCRICLCEDDGVVDDPLVDPCQCIGSVESVHFRCLERWLQQKHIKKQKNNVSYIKVQNQLICEICQTKLKMNYQSNTDLEKELKINILANPDNNYMILKKQNFQMLIDFNQQNTIKIGRSHQADLRLNDISVSRIHAMLRLDKEDNRFYMKDNKAKFGSLVQLKDGILLESNANGLQLQIDKNIFYLNVKKVKNYKKMMEKRQNKKQIGCFGMKSYTSPNDDVCIDYYGQYVEFDKQYQHLNQKYGEVCVEYIEKMVQMALKNESDYQRIRQNQTFEMMNNDIENEFQQSSDNQRLFQNVNGVGYDQQQNIQQQQGMDINMVDQNYSYGVGQQQMGQQQIDGIQNMNIGEQQSVDYSQQQVINGSQIQVINMVQNYGQGMISDRMDMQLVQNQNLINSNVQINQQQMSQNSISNLNDNMIVSNHSMNMQQIGSESERIQDNKNGKMQDNQNGEMNNSLVIMNRQKRSSPALESNHD